MGDVSAVADPNTGVAVYDTYGLHPGGWLVFGGTSGLGKSIALGLAEAGAAVVPVSRRAEGVAKTAAEIRALGRNTIELTADVTRREDVQRVADAVVKEMKRIDILVNSAGMTKRIPSLECTDEDWDRILSVNVKGTWLACQIVGRVMREQQYGRIINIASIGSFQSLHEAAPYCASKGAVAMLTKALGAEWTKYNIAVNAIAPGFFPTKMTKGLMQMMGDKVASKAPLNRVGGPEDLKGAAVLLASDASAFITGQTIAVDGGYTAQ